MPAPPVRPLLAHWRRVRPDLERLADLYAADPETPALTFPFECVRDLIEVFDALLGTGAQADESGARDEEKA